MIFFIREKFQAHSYDNPIKDAVLKECPEVSHELNDHYGSKLSGDKILNILCNDRCARPTNPDGGKMKFLNKI